MKLSKTQADLLAYMQGGGRVHYMRYMGRFNPTPYYFRSGTLQRCTQAAEGLQAKGLAELVGMFDKEFQLTEKGRTHTASGEGGHG